jgi:hypothetical protein
VEKRMWERKGGDEPFDFNKNSTDSPWIPV